MYGPVLVESRNCEPPKDVHASTSTTIASAQPPLAKRWSSRSRKVGSKATRFAHMSSCPV